ncbi:MAG TPA: bifunctional hydroxymethylpyrimidine kinase/phosphomethylpyrimidine kinase [Acidobacteriaceae bacterium]|nr:bifunctional hydroxymethylpyrimidine kinase/phosphomethylpyrimidine kinase [Acidobacteriaceae bacterium]
MTSAPKQQLVSPAIAENASPSTLLLTIAGFDPSAGAGILADIKTFAAHGLYGMACITALTVQSTLGVRGVEPVAAHTVDETLVSLAGDVQFSAIKIGMLATGELVQVVAAFLRSQPGIPVVLDPILQSSSGASLLDASGQRRLRQDLLALATWITPNINELAALTGRPLSATKAETEASAQALLEMAARLGNPDLRIVVTGGHAHPASNPDDLFLTSHGSHWVPGEWVETNATHGTGCTFSSALAARLVLGDADLPAVEAAKAYVTGALRAAQPIGHGKGPVHHFWRT